MPHLQPWLQLWHWSAASHWPHCRGSHHIPLNFGSESNNDVNIFGWEATCHQNTAAILVLEAQDIIKRNDLLWFLMMMIHDVSEASNKNTFEARWLGFGLQTSCQQPTWSPYMRQDCINTTGNTTTMNATFVSQKSLDLGFQTLGCEQTRTHRADGAPNPAKRRQHDNNKKHRHVPSLSLTHPHIYTHIDIYTDLQI